MLVDRYIVENLYLSSCGPTGSDGPAKRDRSKRSQASGK